MRATSRNLALSLVVLGAACGEAPEPPAGAPPGAITFYGGFLIDAELYAPVVQEVITAAEEYMAADPDLDCFRLAALNRGDSASVALYDFDPSALPGGVQARVYEPNDDVAEWTVDLFRQALLDEDWTEVFGSTIQGFSITEQSDAAAFAAGTSHHYYRIYQADITVGAAEISYESTNQLRLIDDWNGTGQPLMILRGWLGSGATTSSSSATINQLMKYEVYVPQEGGKVMRIVASYSDLDLGLGEDSMFSLACTSLNNSMDDIGRWIEDNAQ